MTTLAEVRSRSLRALIPPVRMEDVEPAMGDKIIINTFAIVVIGGLGSIGGSVVTGFALGLLQALGAVMFPAFNDTLIFMLMIIVLLIKPSGLFGAPLSAK